MLEYKIDGRIGSGTLGRAGVIKTPHGEIKTPAFMVVGTGGEVRYMSMDDLRGTGAQGMLSNGYHLRRRAPEIAEAGGLAQWSGWGGPTVTDSGGFQVMSLGSGLGKVVSMERLAAGEGRQTPHSERLAIVSEEGVTFRDPYDGAIEVMTPESSMDTQWQIGSDIHMAFDELTSIGDSYAYNREALDRTHRWAERCLVAHRDCHNKLLDLKTRPKWPTSVLPLKKSLPAKPDVERSSNLLWQSLYGVLQGAHYEDLRRETARWMSKRDFDGYGIGGAFTKEDLGKILQWVNEELPEGKPRHLLGLSRPDDIFIGVEHGVDTFDCVAPTREARHGRIYTMDGDLNLRKGRFASDNSPLDAGCDCATCRAGWTRSELRALMKYPTMPVPDAVTQKAVRLGVEVNKVGYYRLASTHNVRFVVRLCEQIRQSIQGGNFIELRKEFFARYYRGH